MTKLNPLRSSSSGPATEALALLSSLSKKRRRINDKATEKNVSCFQSDTLFHSLESEFSFPTIAWDFDNENINNCDEEKITNLNPLSLFHEPDLQPIIGRPLKRQKKFMIRSMGVTNNLAALAGTNEKAAILPAKSIQDEPPLRKDGMCYLDRSTTLPPLMKQNGLRRTSYNACERLSMQPCILKRSNNKTRTNPDIAS